MTKTVEHRFKDEYVVGDLVFTDKREAEEWAVFYPTDEALISVANKLLEGTYNEHRTFCMDKVSLKLFYLTRHYKSILIELGVLS